MWVLRAVPLVVAHHVGLVQTLKPDGYADPITAVAFAYNYILRPVQIG